MRKTLAVLALTASLTGGATVAATQAVAAPPVVAQSEVDADDGDNTGLWGLLGLLGLAGLAKRKEHADTTDTTTRR